MGKNRKQRLGLVNTVVKEKITLAPKQLNDMIVRVHINQMHQDRLTRDQIKKN
jgi:hypothetical protein